jgi:hypothetical protein
MGLRSPTIWETRRARPEHLPRDVATHPVRHVNERIKEEEEQKNKNKIKFLFFREL